MRTADVGQWLSNFREHENHLEGLLKHKLLGSTPRISDIVSQEWDPRIYISNKFPGDAEGPLLCQDDTFRSTDLRYFRCR